MGKLLRIAICTAILTLGAGMANAHHVKCSRDINNDGKANQRDVKIIENAMGSKVGVGPYDERADLDTDGRVNEDDREAYQHCLPIALMRGRGAKK
jgi:hypothetical protein